MQSSRRLYRRLDFISSELSGPFYLVFCQVHGPVAVRAEGSAILHCIWPPFGKGQNMVGFKIGSAIRSIERSRTVTGFANALGTVQDISHHTRITGILNNLHQLSGRLFLPFGPSGKQLRLRQYGCNLQIQFLAISRRGGDTNATRILW